MCKRLRSLLKKARRRFCSREHTVSLQLQEAYASLSCKTSPVCTIARACLQDDARRCEGCRIAQGRRVGNRGLASCTLSDGRVQAAVNGRSCSAQGNGPSQGWQQCMLHGGVLEQRRFLDRFLVNTRACVGFVASGVFI